MNQKNIEYTLDFVIPQGPTGPGNLQDICFLSFAEARTGGSMKVQDSIIIPDNSDTFTVSADSFTIEKNGIYEITFCGRLEESGDTKGVSINLYDTKNGSLTTVPNMAAKLPAGSPSIHFSETIMAKFAAAPRNLIVRLTYFGTGQISATLVNVLVKRLSD